LRRADYSPGAYKDMGMVSRGWDICTVVFSVVVGGPYPGRIRTFFIDILDIPKISGSFSILSPGFTSQIIFFSKKLQSTVAYFNQLLQICFN